MVNPTYIMLSTVNKIVKNFPFPAIFLIVGKPNYKTIAKVYFKLNANSSSIQSDIGDGQLRLLFLTVSLDVYNTLSATDFVPQVNLDANTIITASAAVAVIANKRRSFTDATALFKQYDSSEKSLNQMLISAVD